MPVETRIAHLAEFARVQAFRIPAESRPLRHRWDQVRSILTKRTESRWRYDDAVYRRRLMELVFERDPRIVHVDGISLHAYLPLLAGRAVVLAHHRTESLHLRQRAGLARGLDRTYLARQAEWVKKAEQEWLPRVTASVVTSERDREALLALAPGARVETVAAAVDTVHFAPAPGTGHGLAFVGGATAPASRDALEYFAAEILPRLRRGSGLQALEPISWVGGAREGDRERYRQIGIDITGYVEDIRPIVRPSACYIAPRRVAGGTTRVLQAWAMGKAVVSTSAGCEGLHAVDGENILVRDDPADFARAVTQVLESSELRRRLGQAARRTAEEEHSWDRQGERLLSLYMEAEAKGG